MNTPGRSAGSRTHAGRAIDAEAVSRALAADDPPSPCVSVCSIDAASGLCAGCWRTLDEIAAWSTLDAADRRTVWAAIADRAGLPVQPRPATAVASAGPAAPAGSLPHKLPRR